MLLQGRTNYRYGIVLSGGNGIRLRDFIRQRWGHDLPKQYVEIAGGRSMLEDTLRRAEKLIPPQRLLLIIAKEHLRFRDVLRQIAPRPRSTVVVQPENKDTAPGIFLPLLHIYKRRPEATVAVFPSDHFVREEDRFMEHVDRAFRVVESDSSNVVLLGVRPRNADPEYGYIVPGEGFDRPGLDSVRKVALFVEKPPVKAARKIIASGALWNTLILVGKCETLVQVIRQTQPGLYHAFEPVMRSLGTVQDSRTIERVYSRLTPLNFSRAILQVLPFQYRQRLAVLPVQDVTWSDCGNATRLLHTFEGLKGTNEAVKKLRFLGNTSG